MFFWQRTKRADLLTISFHICTIFIHEIFSHWINISSKSTTKTIDQHPWWGSSDFIVDFKHLSVQRISGYHWCRWSWNFQKKQINIKFKCYCFIMSVCVLYNHIETEGIWISRVKKPSYRLWRHKTKLSQIVTSWQIFLNFETLEWKNEN